MDACARGVSRAEAILPKRKRFQGTTMASGRVLPHDLAQFVIESPLGLQHGFWGPLANGATFKSVAGRRRTQPGQQLIRAYSEELNAAEHLVNAHVAAWRAGTETLVGPDLDAMLVRWRTLLVGEKLCVDWLTHNGWSQFAKRVRRSDRGQILRMFGWAEKN